MRTRTSPSGVKPRLRQALLSCLLALVGTPAHASTASTPPFRPPAVPLVTHDPYFSIWSPANQLTDADTIHWTGKPHRLTGLVRVDGKAFRLMGTSPTHLPAMRQMTLEVLPTRTIYAFEGEGVQLTLTFLTPAVPDDLRVCSRPATYVTWEARSVDRREHGVQVYFDAAAEIAVNDPSQPVTGSRMGILGQAGIRLGSAEQPVLRKKGDDLRIDWGSLLLVAPEAQRPRSAIARASECRTPFAATGSFVQQKDQDLPRRVAEDAPVLAFCFDLGVVGDQPVNRWLVIAYDDEFSIKYFGNSLRPYWRRKNATSADLARWALRDHSSLAKRCAAFDAGLMADLRRVGGEKYAQLCALAYRQTLAGNKICADANGQPLMFPKENFSNGCIGTVDVLFPQAPFFLVFSPALTKAMLVPILDYAASPRWPYDYAPHDLGTYPHATGQVYGMGGTDGDRMPLEESGNMLIMLAALAKQQGNADLAKSYWPMLKKWADYLVNKGLDPQNQLCSADMFGHLPRNANLALKAVIGVGGFAQLCELAGKPDEARKYLGIAGDYATRWQQLAKDEGRTVLAYGQSGTWAMKHNLIWDRVLAGRDAFHRVPDPRANSRGGEESVPAVGYRQLFPDSVGDAEVAWYLKVQERYGLPVDNRTDTSLIDWAVWSIALARSEADFQELLAPLYRYANETPSRVPLCDWFVTTDAKQKGFQARPVVGGLFMKLLADPAMWAKWSKRGGDTQGPWAPFPVSVPAKEVVPTAQTAQVKWRYTLEKPAEDWAKPGFDDSTWKEGVGGFGTKGTPGAILGTEWKTQEIWLRRKFTLSDRPLKNPRLSLIYDEDPEVYLNGVLAAKLTGWATDYEEVDLAPAALATFKPGKNVLAVHARQTYGGQCIDVGLVGEAGGGNSVLLAPRSEPEPARSSNLPRPAP